MGGVWHWDYDESVVKALTFLFLFHDPRFGFRWELFSSYPKIDWLPSWSPKLRDHHFQESSRLPCLAPDWPPPDRDR